jgi:imidazolonepropionase-like amidohydrolase
MRALLLGLVLCAAPAAPAQDAVAVKAGTLHLVAGGQVLTGGGTVLIVDGKIAAVGKDVSVPAGARVVDYGADAVLVPGLVAADSAYGDNRAADQRTAAPTVRGSDAFDPYSRYLDALGGGVTSAYIAPARNRLIAGQGAVVKLHGDDHDARMLNARACLHGSISGDARNAPGFWEPPLPATVDVGLGVAQPQLPRSTMGAVVALRELFALQAGDTSLVSEYGRFAGPALKELIAAGVPWRMGANDPREVRALLEVFSETGLPLMIDGAEGAAELASELAKAGVTVLYEPRAGGTSDFGKGPDGGWPEYDGASKLVAAGVNVVVKPMSPTRVRDLRLAAAFAMRGGMPAETALRAVTLAPAEALGVASRVGSLEVGKDGDLVVLNGAPLATATSVQATWVSGEIAWKRDEASATVISADELHLGDGHVLTPGEVLLVGGRIAEVGQRVGRPPGATVVHGAAAMPGMIDAHGYLGLAGSRRNFSTRFDLTRIVAPGDEDDKRVAQAGVTTVNLTSRSLGGNSPTMAYKPASQNEGRMVVGHPNAMYLEWDSAIPSAKGGAVRSALENAKKYKDKWDEYEQAIAAWTPPAPEAQEDEKQSDEAQDGEEQKDDAESGGEDKDEKKKKKEPELPLPVTGVWEGTATHAGADPIAVRLRLHDDDGALTGNLRADALADLVELTGTRTDKAVLLTGLSELGDIAVTLEESWDKDAEQLVLTGKSTTPVGEADVRVVQVSTEWVVAGRAERRKVEEPKEPKGKPRPPGINPDLEPLRQAMLGRATIIVSVEREDDIVACVDECAKYGIQPVLYGGGGAAAAAGRIRGRVKGVLLRGTGGTASLAAAGIPMAFYSAAEEGAALMMSDITVAVGHGLSPQVALRSVTSDAAKMLSIDRRVGSLAPGLDGDVVLLDGPPFQAATSVLRVWVDGEEVR